MPALTIEQAMRHAVERHTAGFLDEAEGIYRQVLAHEPENVEVMNLLGRIAADRGQLAEAAELIGRAVQAVPQESRYQISWSLLQRARGDLAGAIVTARRAVELAPRYAPAGLNLAMMLEEAGDLSGAEATYRATLQVAPEMADTHNDLGVLLDRVGRKDEAIAALRRAIELRPDYPDAQCNLALLLNGRRQCEAAVALLREVMRAHPNFARAHRLLGASLGRLGRFGEAITALQKAIQLEPSDAMTHHELGVAFWQSKQAEPAIAAWLAALQIEPQQSAALQRLGVAYIAGNEPEKAVACYEKLLKLEPDNAWHPNNLAAALKAMGDIDGALAKLREARRLDPTNSQIHSGMVCTMLFDPKSDEAAQLAECEAWNRAHADPLRGAILPHENGRDPERRLRVGYVSPNFWAHVIGRNIRPLFQHHDRSQFEVCVYADMRVTDEMTKEFHQLSDHWCNTLEMSDEAVAAKIRQDGVDILVDLNLHLANDRLPIFVRQPAPVQLSFAGYPGTAAVDGIGYRISDRWLEGRSLEFEDRGSRGDAANGSDLPSPSSHRRPAERVFYLPSFWCYAPREHVEVNELPAATGGAVTFGCFNNFFKINGRVLALWGRVLEAVPGSRLVVQAPAGRAQEWIAERLRSHEVGPERFGFVSKLSHRDYLGLYHHIDIMLDTFPYNGHTTSLDALWMGVPVITLAGKTVVGRAGVSQLNNVGLPELIAESEGAFVAKAVELAGDLERLAELRRTLRGRLEASPIMDVVGFARGIEAAYRAMWREWCVQAVQAS